MHPIYPAREALLQRGTGGTIRRTEAAGPGVPARARVAVRRARAADALCPPRRGRCSQGRAGDRAGERALSDPGRSRRAAQYLFSTRPGPAGWASGDHRDPRRGLAAPRQGGVWRPDRKCFRAAGYVVVAPNYALSAPGHPTWPTNLDDVRSVVAWVRSNASELGIDPDRVVAMGESAGGNLAELLGTDPGPSRNGICVNPG